MFPLFPLGQIAATPGSELPFSLGPQPTFRLLGPVKSSPKMPHPDSGERPLSVF